MPRPALIVQRGPKRPALGQRCSVRDGRADGSAVDCGHVDAERLHAAFQRRALHVFAAVCERGSAQAADAGRARERAVEASSRAIAIELAGLGAGAGAAHIGQIMMGNRAL